MKQLKFMEQLAEQVLRREKDITWRINDDKNISEGDQLSLCYNDGKEFARAIAMKVSQKKFGELKQEDCKGHETFDSEEEMYKTYSGYYGFEVTPETELKVIRFKLI